ncbi:AlpA family phage regulatory protein [Escherichia coli]|nr:AlpA family phage regulatory protein [Escherichia coli]WBZ23033.1 AlpA family phage regulatory protein [Escherichia coli]
MKTQPATGETYPKSDLFNKALANNTFPRPVKIGTRAISFVESEVDHWIQEQIYASRGERYENH